ncbi:MAG: hypothetical protein WCC25_08570, partial [Candidatus Korobacteraceae bacterium]
MTCSNQLRSFVRLPIAAIAIFLVIFATIPAQAQTLTVLHSLTGASDGASPGGSGLSMDRAGNLYGGTGYGGLQGSQCYA